MAEKARAKKLTLNIGGSPAEKKDQPTDVIIKNRRKDKVSLNEFVNETVASQPMKIHGTRQGMNESKEKMNPDDLFPGLKKKADAAKKKDNRELSDTEQERRQQALKNSEQRQKEAVEAEALKEVEEKLQPAERSKAEEIPAKEPESDVREIETTPDDIAELQANEKANEKSSSHHQKRRNDDEHQQKKKPVKRDSDRRQGKISARDVFATDEESGETQLIIDTDDSKRKESNAARKRRREKRRKNQSNTQPTGKVTRDVVIPETITVADLATRMSEQAKSVITLLAKQGVMREINDVLDAETAQLVVEELGHRVKKVVVDGEVEDGLFEVPDDGKKLPRPPCIGILGHVDHGKTSLLDALRKKKDEERYKHVTDSEHGGITQHISSYQFEKNGKLITFLDTPGHLAFAEQRKRGAQATDIVILVVAADDSVQPQTREAIGHAKMANTPIVVAINKIDMPGANAQKVKVDLTREDILVEDMGGQTLCVEISAKTGQGLDELIENVLLQAEMMELNADPHRIAEGVVIESRLDKGRGNVATLLVQKGTLNIGDILVAGSEYARVKAMIDENGGKVETAVPSQPVEVLGFQGIPDSGERFIVVESEARAREISGYRLRKKREKAILNTSRYSLEQMMTDQGTVKKTFTLLIKADVAGSIEAITNSLTGLNTEEVEVNIIFANTGGINESDVALASAAGAVIMGFNVRVNSKAQLAADQNSIEIRFYNIIYDLIDDVKNVMSGMLPPERRETELGRADILEVFHINKVGKVAGCKVTDGVALSKCSVRLIRDDVVVWNGQIAGLKNKKDEAKEMKAGQECGVSLEDFQDMKKGDRLEFYKVEEIERSL